VHQPIGAGDKKLYSLSVESFFRRRSFTAGQDLGGSTPAGSSLR
jgi:hypothetical protein